MGAVRFNTISLGPSARQAFRSAKSEAMDDYGCNGFTGTIAEKEEFINIRLPQGNDPYDFINGLLDNDDPRVSGKWDPAGCVDITDSTYAIDAGQGSGNRAYLFFGYSPE